MQQAGSLIMVVLLISGLLDKALSFVINHVAMGAGTVMEAAARFTGLI